MVRMRDRAGAQLVEVKVRVPELEQARTELVLVRIAVLLHEAVRLKGLEQAVDSGPGEAETFRELADAEPAGSARQRLQDRRGAVDRLDRRAALASCAIIRHC